MYRCTCTCTIGNEIQFLATVKPALVTTCPQRPHFFVSLKKGFSLKHELKEPVYKDQFLCFPWAVAIARFDCINELGKSPAVDNGLNLSVVVFEPVHLVKYEQGFTPHPPCSPRSPGICSTWLKI